MTNTMRHVAAAAAIFAGATSAFATNGVNLIGLSAEQRGMGGVGISVSHGAQSALVNPALVKGREFSIDGTWFSPSVKFKNDNGVQGQDYLNSKSSNFVMPEVAIAYDVNEWFTWGVGMYGVSGMGVDYRNDVVSFDSTSSTGYQGTEHGTNQLFTNLQIMRFAIPLAFRPVEGLSLAVSPIFQYGSLGISYNNGASFMSGQNPTTAAPIYSSVNTGYGTSSDYGWGWNIGAAYEIIGITIGAVYTSQINASYANQISTASKNFGLGTLPFTNQWSDSLDSPAEVGVGISYNILESGHTIGFDWKQIRYGDAKGYKDFGWENQNVFMVGYQYEQKKSWAVRLGYNYAKNPIKSKNDTSMSFTGTTDLYTAANMAAYENAVINYFNLGAFPAVVEQHFTIGGTVFFTDQVSLSLSYVYAPEKSVSSDTTAYSQMSAGSPLASSTASVKHSQNSITAGLNVSF